jgi:hypothetical protein
MKTKISKHITDADLRGIPTECQEYGRRMRRRNAWSDAGLIVFVGSLVAFAQILRWLI